MGATIWPVTLPKALAKLVLRSTSCLPAVREAIVPCWTDPPLVGQLPLLVIPFQMCETPKTIQGGQVHMSPSKSMSLLAAFWGCLRILWRTLQRTRRGRSLWRPPQAGAISADATVFLLEKTSSCVRGRVGMNFCQTLEKKSKLLWKLWKEGICSNSKNGTWCLCSQPPDGDRQARGEGWWQDGQCTCVSMNIYLG